MKYKLLLISLLLLFCCSCNMITDGKIIDVHFNNKRYIVTIQKEVNGKIFERNFTFEYNKIKHLVIDDYIYIDEIK